MMGQPDLRPMKDRLQTEGHRFDFYQAVRLLELLCSKGATDGPTRFRSRISLQFPPSDIHEIRFPEGQPPEMLVNFMGLAGLLGPLPMPLTETILAGPRGELTTDENGNARREPPPAVDFLDIFNHRLIWLLYRVRQIYRAPLTCLPPHETPIAECLFALIGLGQKSLRKRLTVPDRALLLYSGILARQPRSVLGLQRILSDYFHVPVKVIQFVGRWQRLQREQWTVLGDSDLRGRRGRNVRLGVNAVAGTQIRDEQTCIRVCLGPLPRKEFLAFLPEEPVLAALKVCLQKFLALPKWKSSPSALLKPLLRLATRLTDSQPHQALRLLLHEHMDRLKQAGDSEARVIVERFLGDLENDHAHPALLDLIRFYLPPEFRFRISLVLGKEEDATGRLGSGDLRLGLTSWLSPGQHAEASPLPPSVNRPVRIAKEY